VKLFAIRLAVGLAICGFACGIFALIVTTVPDQYLANVFVGCFLFVIIYSVGWVCVR